MVHRPRAGTDVTGFGLAGHLQEMLQASNVGAVLRLAAIPALPGVRALAAHGIESTLAPENRLLLGDTPDTALLVDPQTSGGLLLGLPPGRATACLDALRDNGLNAAIIGEVEPARDSGRPPQIGMNRSLSPAKTKLRFMHEIRTEDGNILLEPHQHGLADAKRLDRFLISTSKKMLVVQSGDAEEVAKKMGNREMHGYDPFKVSQRHTGRNTHVGAARHGATSAAVLLDCSAHMTILMSILKNRPHPRGRSPSTRSDRRCGTNLRRALQSQYSTARARPAGG